MKKFILIMIVVVILIFSIFTYLDIIDITKHIKLTHNYDWLNFYGTILASVIGGIITYLSVFITIQFTQKENERERVNQIRPYLDFEYFSNIKNEMYIERLENLNREEIGEVKVSNYGLGICVDIKIFSVIEKNKFLRVSKINAITIINSQCIKIGMPKIDLDTILQETWDYIFLYKDILGNNYIQIVTFEILAVERLDNGSYSFPISAKCKEKWYHIGIKEIYQPIFLGKKELEIRSDNFYKIINEYKKDENNTNLKNT